MTAAAAAAAVVEAGVEAVAPANRLGGLGRRLVLVQLTHGPDEARGSLGTVDADEGGSVPVSDQHRHRPHRLPVVVRSLELFRRWRHLYAGLGRVVQPSETDLFLYLLRNVHNTKLNHTIQYTCTEMQT